MKFVTVGREQSNLIDNTTYCYMYHDWAKQLSHYLYFFSFFFSFGLITQEGVQESVMSQVSLSHKMSHDGCGKTVHRPCSSYISSIENLMGTLSSSPYQLRLRE